MKKLIIIIMSLPILITKIYASDIKATQNTLMQRSIEQTLLTSVKCWNAADLKGFMDVYMKSDDTLFISGKKFIKGWQNSYTYYKQKYGADKSGMGNLTIKINGIDILDSHHAFLYGRWYLTINDKKYEGVTSLVFVKVASDWRIMVDHSN